MDYQHITDATFLVRKNRFVAKAELNGQVETVHVKNTGRCRELLIPGCRVFLAESDNPARKTRYDLIAVQKGPLLINMDSQAPNAAIGEWLSAGGLGAMDLIRREYTLGDSRFDFYAERNGARYLIEVKGCTLEENGVARFPDAPTLRGLKHVQELTRYAREGWRCAIIILVQMRPVQRFEPNWNTMPAFGYALQEALAAGVRIIALDSLVTPNSLTAGSPIPILLDTPNHP